jgi:eukaryotic-like serine/threonine-protein kinase
MPASAMRIADGALSAHGSKAREPCRGSRIRTIALLTKHWGSSGRPSVSGRGPWEETLRDDDADRFELAPGTILKGTYVILSRLESGGMGDVYRAEHVRMKSLHVVVKVVRPGLQSCKDYLERLDLEAQTLSRLDHPGIVKILDLATTETGIPFLVMELLKGRDLRWLLLERRYVELPDALALAAKVLEALAHAHDEGIVHRDIKPGNIFLAAGRGKTVPKLLDFGIALARDDRRGLTGKRFIGSLQYAAPEQLLAEPVTEK